MSVIINRNIWTHEPYVYRSTANGVEIYDYESGNIVGHITNPVDVNSVWADDNYVYIASTASGIYRITVTTFSGSYTASLFGEYPEILSNEVNYIHGSGDYLCIASVSGIDSYNLLTDDRISTTISGIGKCFQTSSGRHYFFVNSITSAELIAVYSDSESFTYTSSANGILRATLINDLFISEGTSQYGNGNVIFLATNNGAILIEERQGNEENSRYKYYKLDT